jgi:outer membrane receptor protein involved in Fe transport
MHLSFNPLKSGLYCGVATTAIGIGLMAAPAYAQDTATQETATPPAAASVAQEDNIIIVTGSRIARPDLAASSPVSVVSAEAIKQTNTVTVEQILASNPQFSAAFGSTSNNPGDGSATVDLRGLDQKRTLVLVDGKRAPTYDTQGAVDVNAIPTALIKRIDVLTGGASAVYGSDAVAGVVNFILDDRFEGLKVDGSSQITSRGDGALNDISLTGGVALGDRGNLVVSGGYSKRKGVKYGARKRNSVALDSEDLVSSGGSSNAVPTIFDLTSETRPQVQITDSGILSDDLQLYNFTPVNYAQLPFERYSAMALGRYELSDGIELYGRANYSHISVTQTLAPTATAGFSFNIDPSNPFLTADERAVFFGPGGGVIITPDAVDPDDSSSRVGSSTIGIRRRIVETGGRVEINKTRNMQFVGGLRGDLGESMHWDVFAQYGQSKKSRDFLNDLSYTALKQALDVVPGPNGPQCFDPSGGCVPLNVFTTGTIPQNQLAFVLRNGREDTKITEFIAGGSLSGDLNFLKSPWADKPAAFSVGVEYRSEKGVTLVDANYGSGDLIYYGQGQNISGKYNVKEVYAELKIPIVQDKPFLYALNLEGGFRYSDYSTVGSVYTYKAGGDWSPSEGFRLRGIYQRAVRAPNLYELYSPVVAGTGSLSNDPCAGSAVAANIAAICIAQGAPSVGGIPQPISGQVNVFTGGNPNLSEEKSDTYTLGFVINPPSMKRLSISVDYFNITINGAIDETPPFITVDQCYNVTQDVNSAACQGIVRNNITGSLSGNNEFGVASVLGNIASIKTDGLDVTASYFGGEKDAFSWSISAAGTYTRNYKKKADPAADSVQCAGRFGSACNLEPIAKWKHVVNVNFGFKGINLNTRWRYFGTVKQDVSRFVDGVEDPILKSKIGGFNYFDETVSFEVNDNFTLRAGVLNVFNKKSPIVGDTVGADAVAGSTFPNTYDVLGRQFFAGASVKF